MGCRPSTGTRCRRTPGAGSPPPPACPAFPSGGPVQPHITASCDQWPVAPASPAIAFGVGGSRCVLPGLRPWPAHGSPCGTHRARFTSHPSRQPVRHSLGGVGGPATSLLNVGFARAVGRAGRPLRGPPPPFSGQRQPPSDGGRGLWRALAGGQRPGGRHPPSRRPPRQRASALWTPCPLALAWRLRPFPFTERKVLFLPS